MCVEDRYGKYANFKKRILLKAQEDLKAHTDIYFTFEEVAEYSRRVEKLVFTISKNDSTLVGSSKTNREVGRHGNEAEHIFWHDELRAFGLSETVINLQIV